MTEKTRVPTVPLPARLIDDLMPSLRDTEWRILCVVARCTLGWRDPASGGRKKADWLSRRQLLARTGRASEAVSNAVDALVRKGLLEATDARGRLLATPAERRRHGGAIYYKLSTGILGRSEPESGSLSELRKTNTTKET